MRDRKIDLSWRLWSQTEPPETIPLSWDAYRGAAEQLEAAFTTAEECAEACAEALRWANGEGRRTLAAISGVCRFASECRGVADSDTRRALDLCVRVIETNSTTLDRIGDSADGALVASSARRCAKECSRALAASCLDVED